MLKSPEQLEGSVMFDVAVIGAGIAGTTVAFELQKRGASVALIEQNSPGSAASGAAGAFLSPMIGKPSLLNAFVNESLAFALEYYREHAPEFLVKRGLLRYPKPRERTMFFEYEEYITVFYERREAAFFFPEAGMIDAGPFCRKLAETVTLIQEPVTRLKPLDEGWQAGTVRAKQVVIATGAFDTLPVVPYQDTHGVWGAAGGSNPLSGI